MFRRREEAHLYSKLNIVTDTILLNLIDTLYPENNVKSYVFFFQKINLNTTMIKCKWLHMYFQSEFGLL